MLSLSRARSITEWGVGISKVRQRTCTRCRKVHPVAGLRSLCMDCRHSTALKSCRVCGSTSVVPRDFLFRCSSCALRPQSQASTRRTEQDLHPNLLHRALWPFRTLAKGVAVLIVIYVTLFIATHTPVLGY